MKTDPQGERGSTSGASRVSHALGSGGRLRPGDRRAGSRSVALIPPRRAVAAAATRRRRGTSAVPVEPLGPRACRAGAERDLAAWRPAEPGRGPRGAGANTVRAALKAALKDTPKAGLKDTRNDKAAGTVRPARHRLAGGGAPERPRHDGLAHGAAFESRREARAFRAPGDGLAGRSGALDRHAGRYGEPYGDAGAPTRAAEHLSQQIGLLLVTLKAGRFEGDRPSGSPARERAPAETGTFPVGADATGRARPRGDRDAPPAGPEADPRPPAAVPRARAAGGTATGGVRPARPYRRVPKAVAGPAGRHPASRTFPAPSLSPEGVRDRLIGPRQGIRCGRTAARGELNQEQAHPGGLPGVDGYKEDP